MSNQIVITSGAKVRNLSGVLTGTSGVVSSVPYGGANGVATLDSSGKVPLSQLPASVITYLGTWNASTNTPTLTNGVGDVGDLYICNVAGTVNFGAGPITFAVGDWVIYSGTTWEKSGGASGTVTSVAMTVPTGLSVTGSPITTSGTLAVSLASGYTIPTTSFLSGLVPYTGATGAVNLGAYDLTVNGLTIGKGNSSLSNNTALGYQTLYHATTGNNNTAVGYQAGHNITTGNYNVSIGQSAMFTNTTGGLNTAIGVNALLNNTTGGSNVVVGLDALQHNTTGSSNTALGYNAGSHITGGSTPNTTASSSIYIGRDTKALADGGVNEIVIGYNAVGNGSNTTTFGNTSTTSNHFTGSINAGSFIKSGGTSSQYLMADGSVSTGPDLTGYVPYTGATSSVNLGIYGFTAASIYVAASGSNAGQIQLKQGNTFTTPNGYGTFGSGEVNDFYFYQNSSSVVRGARLSLAYITGGATRTYTLQDASGTLALTSDIPSLTNYVTLTGNQTITGIKTFTNEQLFGNGMTLTGGYITYTSGSFNLTLNTNILTANRNVFIKDGSGTLAFTSDIPSLSGYVQGSGTTNYHAKFTASSTIGNSMLTDDGTTLQSIGATRSNLYLKAASSSYYSQLAFTNGSNGSFGGISYNNSGQYMQFETNSSEWMRLNASGNLSIGNTNDTYKLDVSGTARFTSNVGIGTTTSSNQLEVLGTANNWGVSVSANTTTGQSFGAIVRGGTNASDIAFRVNNAASNTTYFTVNGDGKIGIGTSSPSQILDVRTTSKAVSDRDGVNLSATDSSAANLGLPLIWSANGSISNYATASIAGRRESGTSTNYSGYLQFATTDSSGSLTERMRITSSGLVGIGTSSPDEMVHANGGGFRSQYGSYSAYMYGNYTGGTSGLVATNSWMFVTNGSERMRISSDGKIVMGSSSVSAEGTLQVWRSNSFWNTELFHTFSTQYFMAFRYNSTLIGSIVGGGSSVSYNTTSDYRLKEDLKEINGLEKLSAIKVYDFKWKSNNQRMDGVIAHELAEILPYAVYGEKDAIEKDGTIKAQGVDYSKIVPVLIKAIQELSAKVSALENK